MSGASRRLASHVMYTADRNAHITIAITPPSTDVGLIQLDQGSCLPPTTTRPDAIAPATAPMQYGTRTDDPAKIAPYRRRWRVTNTLLRNAKLEPRSTIPSAARV